MIQKVYALSEITGSIERMFEKFYDRPYWIKAEISALNLYAVSGHCFPLMVEKSEGKVKAQLKATIWKEDLHIITRKFEEATKETFREGLNIMFLAYVRFSSTYGLSLQIIDIEPMFTLGEMALEKMNTITLLKKEEIFLNNKKLKLPPLLKKIAVISVETSKGYNDLIVTLSTNNKGYKVITTLFPAVLQGKGAVESIIRQLRLIKSGVGLFDAVVIVRGGGDDVGLSCYDNIDLAREVALFPVPVITGIGHSTNETVVEMVACVNKITPTDVAHFILAGFQEQEMLLESISMELGKLISDAIIYEKSRVDNFESTIKHNIMYLISAQKSLITGYTARASLSVNNCISFYKQKLSEREIRLKLSDPQNILKRGYSIVRINGKIPDSSSQIISGDSIEIETHKMFISGSVNKVAEKCVLE